MFESCVWTVGGRRIEVLRIGLCQGPTLVGPQSTHNEGKTFSVTDADRNSNFLELCGKV